MKFLGLDLSDLLSDKQTKDIWRSTFPFLILLVVGLVFLLLYSLQFVFKSTSLTLSVLGTTATTAGASLLVGGFLGFLFGVPRINTDEYIEEGIKRNGNTATANSLREKKRTLRPNTNLEQISDWLTKVLVGVGLTQINHLDSFVTSVTTKLTPGFGINGNVTSSPSSAFVLVVLVYFTFCGFFLGFLWSRLYLPQRFLAADELKLVEELDEKVDRVSRQLEKDANAQNLANRQLNSRFPSVEHERLEKAIKETSEHMQMTIFVEAQGIRSDTWNSDLPKMERTIPIFEALVKCRPYHRFHGELGFALKDRKEPNYLRAQEELTKAIDLRGDWQDHGDWTTYYEFNRAICRIELDKSLKDDSQPEIGKASSFEVRDAIIKDLEIAQAGGVLQGKIDDSVIGLWLDANGIERIYFKETVNART